MSSRGPLLAITLLMLGAAGCQERQVSEELDLEALKLDACERTCDTMDTCDPGSFDGMEPDDCFERCMTLLPFLHEENQCGSYEIIKLRCVGDLSCEGYWEFEEGNNQPYPDKDYTAPCVAVYSRSCSTSEPFDLDEPPP